MENLQQHFQQAIAHHQAGELQQAVTAYRHCLAQAPTHAEFHHLLGLALAQLGKLEEAEQALGHAVTLQPAIGLYRNNLAEVQRKRGRLAQAIESFHAALALQPDLAAAHHNLALAYKADNQWTQAEHHLRRAIALQPGYTKAHYNLGNLFLELGRHQEAAEGFIQTLRLQPDYLEALINLGSAQQQLRQYDEAIASYRQALQRDANARTAQLNLATTLQLAGHDAEAGVQFRALASRGGAEAWYALRAAGVFPDIARDNTHIDTLRQRLREALDRCDTPPPRLDLATLHSSGLEPPSQLIYQGRDDLALKQRYAELCTLALPAFEPPLNRGKPRVGFVVTAGHEGVFCKCMGGLIERLPHTLYDIYLVCQPANLAYLQQHIIAPHLRFLPLPRQLGEARELLLRHPFDLLHYWEIGTDSSNYFLPLLRPAPIQCATWGWPVSSGMAQLDHFISAAPLEVAGAASHYSEELVLLPSLPSFYRRPPLEGGGRGGPALPQGQTRYLCSQNLRKIHPDFDPLLAGILRGDPNGIAIFIEDRLPRLGQALRQRWQQTMPELLPRIHFVPQQPMQGYLALLASADVILDTPHYGGGANTTYDALALGKAIVTLPGEFHRSRYCAASYRQLGIGDTTAGGAAEYVAIALRLGREEEWRQQLEQETTLRSELLFEDMRAVDELDSFLQQAIAAIR